MVLITVLSLAPAVLVMVTSFTRIIVVLSFLRKALGHSADAAQRGADQPRPVPDRACDGADLQASYDQGVGPLIEDKMELPTALPRTRRRSQSSC